MLFISSKMLQVFNLNFENPAEAALQSRSYEKVFWKYTANLQENIYAEVWYQ